MDELEITPHAMAHGGEAVARAPDGRAVFVQGGLPDEPVTVRLADERPRFARGVMVAAPRTPSPARVLAPPCQYFGTWPERSERPAAFCGGCQWQHVTYEAQL